MNTISYFRKRKSLSAISVAMGGNETCRNSSSSTTDASSWSSHFWSSASRTKPLLSPSETGVRRSSGEELVRRLGLLDLILIGVGASIGAGIFVVTGTVARDTGPGLFNFHFKYFYFSSIHCF
jgi:APA family basic amino acid/polyamine antiporter